MNRTLEQGLSSVFQLLKSGQPTQAYSKLEPLLGNYSENADVNHLAALVHKALDNTSKAIEYFSRTLSLNDKQPEAHNNLANLYKSLEDFSAAEKHYQKALLLKPSYFEAARNLAICYLAQHKASLAKPLFEQLLTKASQDLISITGLADSHRHLGEFDQAEAQYRNALSLDPVYFNALYKLGQNQHLCGDTQSALTCYEAAHRADPSNSMATIALASTFAEIGSIRKGIDLLKLAIKGDIGNTALHERLNQLIWESEQSSDFGSSYKSAIRIEPQNLELRVSYITQLLMAAHREAALTELTTSLEMFGDTVELLNLKASMHADALEFDSAVLAYRKVLAVGFDKTVSQNLTKALILTAEYAKAQKLLDQLFVHEPNCQLNWGLQSLVWRLTQDERYGWLNNYQDFVKTYTLSPPAGYDSLPHFLESLSKLFLSLHRTHKEPLEQTLKNGTQTAARLLHRPEREIQALRQQLEAMVNAYIASLPDDPSHPFLRRKSKRFQLSGSWSVKLRPNGFHVNHVHPQGWISSSCYISIPRSMTDENLEPQGCIKFGESPLALGDLEVVEKIVRPEPGMVVLFPSYLWHGTYPFAGASDEFRLTSPFDIEPI